MKQQPTMSKVLIVFLLANWNLSLPVSVACVAELVFPFVSLTFSDLPIVLVGSPFIKSVLILLVSVNPNYFTIADYEDHEQE